MEWPKIRVKEDPEGPEDGLSDLSTEDIPKPRAFIKKVDAEFERANSDESARAFRAELMSIGDLIDEVRDSSISFIDEKKNAIVQNDAEVKRFQADLARRLTRLREQFDSYLTARINVQPIEEKEKKNNDGEGEAWQH